MDFFIQEATKYLLPIALALVSAVAGLGIAYLQLAKAKVQAQTASIKNADDRALVNKVITDVEDILETVVVETNQDLVDDLKKSSEDGTLTPAEMKKAFQTTYNRALQLMGTELKAKAEAAIPNFESWLIAKIKYYVGVNKTTAVVSTPLISNVTNIDKSADEDEAGVGNSDVTN